MSEDELLRALGRQAREDSEGERARLDERWDALAAGTLPPEEVEQLRLLAASSPAAAAAWEAFRPLDAPFRERVAAAIRAEGSPAATAPIVAEPTVRRFPSAGERRRRSPWHWALPVGALLAASFFVWARVAAPPPLLPYHLAVEGGVKVYRSGEPAAASETLPLALAAGNRLLVTLTPESAIEGQVTAGLYLVRDGVVRPLAGPQIEVASGGSVRLSATIGREVELPPGDSELLVLVARPRALPAPEKALAQLGDAATTGGEGWQLWRVPVRLERGS